MDAETAIQTRIEPDLVNTFGREVANSLLTLATVRYVTTDGSERERYEAFVHSICSDARVTSVWDDRAVARWEAEWKALVQPLFARRTTTNPRSNATMTAKILDGRALARTVRQEVVAAVADFKARHGFAPTIAVVRVGEDPASVSYAGMIKRSFEKAGMGFVQHTLPETSSQEQVLALVTKLNADGDVHGVIVQEPLPKGIDGTAVKAALSPDKDADGVNPVNAGRLAQAAPVGRASGVQDYFVPATPLGGLEILKRSGVEIDGKQATVVGRSNIVGRPMAFLLMQHHATVSVCHSHTASLGEVTRQADILCVAVGVPKLIKAEMVKPGAVVVDFGFNRVEDQWVGDVDFEGVKGVAGMITPVPGGTGSMTNVMLMKNVLQAASRQVEG